MKLKNSFNQDKDKKITNQNQKNNDQIWYKIKCWQMELKTNKFNKRFKTKNIVIKRIRTKFNSINQWLDFFKFMQA